MFINKRKKYWAPQTEDSGDNSAAGIETQESIAPEGNGAYKALQQERARAKALEKELSDMRSRYGGIDPDTVTALKSEKEAREQADLEAQKRYEESLTKVREKSQQELTSVQKTKIELEQKIESMILESAILDAYVEAGGRGEEGEGKSHKAYAKLLIPQIRNSLKIENDEVIVVDANGERRFNPEKGGYLGLADLMAECRKGAMGVLFEPLDKAQGIGATANRKGAPVGSNTMERLNAMSPADRITEARRLGIA